MLILTIQNKLWFVNEKIIVLAGCEVCKFVFQIVHDKLEHFGFAKTYESIWNSFFWPNMCCDLKDGYITGCDDCQKNRSPILRLLGPLHPLLIPDRCLKSVAIDFIGPLPRDGDCDCIATMTCCMGTDIHFASYTVKTTVQEMAHIFFIYWYCKNSLPNKIVCDRNKLFILYFWQALMKLTSIKVKMSSSYHLESDGSGKWTIKTLNQYIYFHVKRNQAR